MVALRLEELVASMERCQALGGDLGALAQFELEQEVAYQLVLEPMWKARAFYHRRIHEEFLAAGGSERDIEEERCTYLQQTAKEHLALFSLQH